jgi:pimeloyl-ACP methyl ester carboxylesterase
MNRIYRRSIRLLLVPVGIYLAICAALFGCQRDLLYHPDTTLADPAAAGLPSAALEHLKTPDGEDLVVWWVPPRTPDKPVFLYFHGNGGNLTYRPKRFALLSADGAGVMAVSWRGYGGSTGSPTEQGLMADARAAYASVRSRTNPDRIVLVGESLGSGVAVMLAAEVPVAAVILDSGYSSITDVAADKFPWLPVRLLIQDEFRADLAAGNVQVPVFQVHCTDDPVIPLVFGRRLHQLFPNRRDLIEVPGQCHPVAPSGFEAVLMQFRAEMAD